MKGSSNKDALTLIVEPYLYLGPRTCSTPSVLSGQNITHVLSIGSSPPSNAPDVTYTRLSLPDDPSSSIEAVVNKAILAINAAKDKNEKILVHCSAAVSRSPTIVAAYLMHTGLTLRQALAMIIQARPAVCPNSGFVAQLKEMDTKLYGECSLDIESLPGRKEDRLALFE